MPVAASSLAGRGEALVCDHLKKKKFSILARNFAVKGGEIDIIARKGSLVCFVEVKTRKSLKKGRGVEAVTAAKLKKIHAASKLFIGRHRLSSCRHRIDVAEVLWQEEDDPRINYIENVFQED
ncbi:MAG: YraN family protein [Pseudomonadota bacterium]